MKKILSFFTRKGNRGFTMVEMIVSVAVLGILMIGIVAFITPVVQNFNQTKKNLVAENVSTCIQQYITSSVRNASHVVIFANTNDDKLKANGSTAIKELKTYCNEKTSDGKQAYDLKCLSLRYDDTDGRYYMYFENIPVGVGADPNAVLNSADRYNVYSKSLYKDLYTDFTFSKAVDLDKTTPVATVLRKDTIDMDVITYTDKAHNNPVFVGTGLTELRQIKYDIIKNGTKSKLELKLFNGESAVTSDSVKTSDGTDGARNLYIYYVVRHLDYTATP